MKKTISLIMCAFAILSISSLVLARVEPRFDPAFNFERNGLGFDTYGEAVAVGDDGSVYVAGMDLSVVPNQCMYLAKLDKKGGVVWQKTIGACSPSDSIKAIVVKGDSVYVCGTQNTTFGFIKKFTTSGSGPIWSFDVPDLSPPSDPSGIHSLCIDPADGTIWAVSAFRNGASLNSTLYHLADNGSSYQMIGPGEHLKYDMFDDAVGLAVAVDENNIYVAGATWDGGGSLVPWIAAKGKKGTGWIFSNRYNSAGTFRAFYSIGLAGGNLYAVYSEMMGQMNAGNDVTVYKLGLKGEKIGQAFPYTNFASGSPAFRPSIAVHPSQPLIAVAGGWNNTQVIGLDLGLNRIWQTSPFGAEWIAAIAFTPGLYSQMYAAGTYWNAGWEIMKVAGLVFEEKSGSPSVKLVVAPNLIELQGAVRTASFSLKTNPNTDFDIRIFDAGGNYLRSYKGTTGSNGYGSVSWDMKDRNGALVAPGTYYATTNAEGGKRAAFMVVTRRTQ